MPDSQLSKLASEANARFERDQRRAFRAATDSWWSREAAVNAWRLTGLTAWRAALAGENALTSPDIGRLEAALRDRRVRDAVMACLIPGAGQAPETSLIEGQDHGMMLAFDLVSRGEVRAGTAEIARMQQLLGLICAYAAPGCAAPALSVAAWLEWWEGNGPRAAELIGRALADDPGYRFASLLRQVLNAGITPGWARGNHAQH